MKKLRLYSVIIAMLFGGAFFTACEGDFDDVDKSNYELELDSTEGDEDEEAKPGQG